MKHTPGPWMAVKNDLHPYVVLVDNSNGKFPIGICKMYSHTEQQANANLIAAAPEMLTELKRVKELLGTIQEATGHHFDVSIKLLELVINKAEGVK